MAKKAARWALTLVGGSAVAGCGSLFGIGDLPGPSGDSGADAVASDTGPGTGSHPGEAGGDGAGIDGPTGDGPASDGPSSDGGATPCSSGIERCSGQQPQTCNDAGTWANTGTACTNACVSGGCTGTCKPGATQCSATGVPQVCDDSGAWQNKAACDSTSTCNAGTCQLVAGPSCATPGPGSSDCGPTESCCVSPLTAGGGFLRSYDGVTRTAQNDFTSSAAPATVSPFRLDKYEVTVGRFRQFVSAAPQWIAAGNPAAGSGVHSHLNGGRGLQPARSAAGTPEPGWDPSWTTGNVPTAPADWDSALLACGGQSTWSHDPAARENFPVTCVNWYAAYAFCIWDRGFLPSEAEWNYAASGGPDQRVYPWSVPSSSPAVDPTFANYCSEDDAGVNCMSSSPIQRVGADPSGNAKWGQADLSGNAYEWTIDWIDSYVTPCVDCAQFTINPSDATKVTRGGSFEQPSYMTYASFRGPGGPMAPSDDSGFRCARAP